MGTVAVLTEAHTMELYRRTRYGKLTWERVKPSVTYIATWDTGENLGTFDEDDLSCPEDKRRAVLSGERGMAPWVLTIERLHKSLDGNYFWAAYAKSEEYDTVIDPTLLALVQRQVSDSDKKKAQADARKFLGL